MKKKILIVDDSAYMRSLVREALEPAGYEIVGEASNGESAIDLAYELHPDLITLDNILPDMVGLEVIKALNKSDEEFNVLIVSAVGQQTMQNKGRELGAKGYVVKPFSPNGLLSEVNSIFASP